MVVASFLAVSCAQSRRAIAPAPADEPCNGIDDDGDGAVDEGCPCTSFDVRLSIGDAGPTGLVWTGSGYIFDAPAMDGSLAFHGVDATGEHAWLATSPHLVEAGSYDRGGAMAWDGRELAMLIFDPAALRLALEFFDPQTRSFHAASQRFVSPVGKFVGTSCIAFAGDRFGVAWVDYTGADDFAAHFEELAPSGAPVSSEITLPLAGDTALSSLELSSLTHTSSGYLLLLAQPQMLLAFIDPTGATPPRLMPVDVGVGEYPQLALRTDGFSIGFGQPFNDTPLTVDLFDMNGDSTGSVVLGAGIFATVAESADGYVGFTAPRVYPGGNLSEFEIEPESGALSRQAIATIPQANSVINSTAASARAAVAVTYQLPTDESSSPLTEVKEIIQRCGAPDTPPR